MKVDENFYLIGGLIGCNVGVIKSEEEVALVDSGWTNESVNSINFILELIAGKKPVKLKYIFLTHTDYDHVGGIRKFKESLGAEVVVHEDEAEVLKELEYPFQPCEADVTVRGEEEFEVGALKLRIIHTPGHSRGCICIYCEERGYLYSGDMILGKRFHPFYSREIDTPIIRDGRNVYIESLRRLLPLNMKFILPGHGEVIKNAKDRIQYFIRFAEDVEERALNLLREPLTPSELTLRLGAHPLYGEFLIRELLNNGKIRQAGMKTIKEELTYITTQ